MNLRDLQYLAAVAELRNFSQAAEQCCVSQPTLSGQIKKLERELGVQLFERTNRRVMLTETGAAVLASARVILREADFIKALAASAREPLAGNFRLGAFPTLSTYVFPALAPKIKRAMPKLKLILIEEKTAPLIEQLKNGEIDAALLALPVQDDFLTSQKLFEDPFYLALPPGHALARHTRVEQSALARHKLLLLEEGHCLRDQALALCASQGSAEEQDFRATGLETLRQMVKAGSGITLIPEVAIRPSERGIRYLPFTAPAPFRTIGLVWRKTSARTPVIERLIKLAGDLANSGGKRRGKKNGAPGLATRS